MKMYITTHGSYEYKHVSLCTIDFDFAIQHFLNYYHEDEYWNSFNDIEVWENNENIFIYGDENHDIINYKKDLTYEEIKNDFMKRYEEEVGCELK